MPGKAGYNNLKHLKHDRQRRVISALLLELLIKKILIVDEK